MRLYYAPRTISVAVAIALYEAEIPFEMCPVNFRDSEQTKPEYLAINPKGRVPTLEVDDERLSETGALLEYVAALKPEAKLTPTNPVEAAHMRSVMFYLASTMHVNHAHKMRGSRWADLADSHADMTAKVPETMTQSAHYIQENCLRGDYVLGSQLSIADPYLFVICTWLEGDGVDLSQLPIIAGFIDRMRNRPSVQKAIENGMLSA
ncbi:MAG: glutathione S-transferase family protein [Roseobacter sp.]